MARGEYVPPAAQTPRREKPTLLEEAVTLRDQVRDLTGQLQEAIEERDQAKDELAQLRQVSAPAALPAPDPEANLSRSISPRRRVPAQRH